MKESPGGPAAYAYVTYRYVPPPVATSSANALGRAFLMFTVGLFILHVVVLAAAGSNGRCLRAGSAVPVGAGSTLDARRWGALVLKPAASVR